MKINLSGPQHGLTFRNLNPGLFKGYRILFNQDILKKHLSRCSLKNAIWGTLTHHYPNILLIESVIIIKSHNIYFVFE